VPFARTFTSGIGVAPFTFPPSKASPPPLRQRQLSITVLPTNRIDRPSVLAWNLNSHVVPSTLEEQ
jgi:hypothetical protein